GSMVAAAGELVRAVQLPDVPRHPGCADVAVPVVVDGPGSDPQAGPVQGGAADPQGWPAEPFLQGRYADHGRLADPAQRHPGGAGVGGPGQPLRVAGAGGDDLLRRHWLVRRLDQDRPPRSERPEVALEIPAAVHLWP